MVLDPGSGVPQAVCLKQSRHPRCIRPVKKDELWLQNEALLQQLLKQKMLEDTLLQRS